MTLSTCAVILYAKWAEEKPALPQKHTSPDHSQAENLWQRTQTIFNHVSVCFILSAVGQYFTYTKYSKSESVIWLLVGINCSSLNAKAKELPMSGSNKKRPKGRSQPKRPAHAKSETDGEAQWLREPGYKLYHAHAMIWSDSRSCWCTYLSLAEATVK